MEPQPNYFAHETAAKRYAESRPYFHPLVITKIKDYLHLATPLADALDVACGTGSSGLALTAIADKVQAIDTSSEMLAQAPAHPRISYRQSQAEEIPFANVSFDLITVSLAFHWFDRERFLAEASRLLRPAAWLVIYNNGFAGRMLGNDEFSKWSSTRYLARYPSPPRHGSALTEKELKPHGLRFVHEENYENEVLFTKDALARYLMTQSNVIAAVEQGRENVESVYGWLMEELEPLLGNGTGAFPFSGYVWYVRREL